MYLGDLDTTRPRPPGVAIYLNCLSPKLTMDAKHITCAQTTDASYRQHYKH